ncbi:MAG: hypothetical protein EOO65_02755 [Methanosarcinales archaeon]|nr:MAG: hypothetical protein EOO65_02755 [Methanosarcinales archaeon]
MAGPLKGVTVSVWWFDPTTDAWQCITRNAAASTPQQWAVMAKTIHTVVTSRQLFVWEALSTLATGGPTPSCSAGSGSGSGSGKTGATAARTHVSLLLLQPLPLATTGALEGIAHMFATDTKLHVILLCDTSPPLAAVSDAFLRCCARSDPILASAVADRRLAVTPVAATRLHRMYRGWLYSLRRATPVTIALDEAAHGREEIRDKWRAALSVDGCVLQLELAALHKAAEATDLPGSLTSAAVPELSSIPSHRLIAGPWQTCSNRYPAACTGATSKLGWLHSMLLSAKLGLLLTDDPTKCVKPPLETLMEGRRLPSTKRALAREYLMIPCAHERDIAACERGIEPEFFVFQLATHEHYMFAAEWDWA